MAGGSATREANLMMEIQVLTDGVKSILLPQFSQSWEHLNNYMLKLWLWYKDIF